MRVTTNQFVPKIAAPVPRRLDHWCLVRLVQALQGAAVRIELWDGQSACTSDAAPIVTVRVRDRGTLVRLVLRPALEFGEAYSAGRLEFNGDLVAGLESVNRALEGRPYQSRAPRPHRVSTLQARDNVHVHYDVGNEFYRLWLDDSMAYTCAYFERPDVTLDAAQIAKYDYVCRKLQLRPGDRVVEAGCGWGGLACHMAKRYGVRVWAYNISAAQLDVARERARALGLDGQVTFVDGDYRSIADKADAFVSVGMLEHVGREHYAELGATIDRVLHPMFGRGLVHFIGRNTPMPFNPWITRHIFPGAYAPALSEVLPGVLESHRLSVLDVENLRMHYVLTLRHWLARFEAHAADLSAVFDAAFVRTWRLYLASAQASFTTGDLQLFQVTFGRPTDNTRPWTRADLYQS